MIGILVANMQRKESPSKPGISTSVSMALGLLVWIYTHASRVSSKVMMLLTRGCCLASLLEMERHKVESSTMTRSRFMPDGFVRLRTYRYAYL